eukprot:749597-Hanusia_phi.AAC.2
MDLHVPHDLRPCKLCQTLTPGAQGLAARAQTKPVRTLNPAQRPPRRAYAVQDPPRAFPHMAIPSPMISTDGGLWHEDRVTEEAQPLPLLPRSTGAVSTEDAPFNL